MDFFYFITGVGFLKQIHEPPREWRLMDMSAVPFFYTLSMLTRWWLFPIFYRCGFDILVSTRGEEFALQNKERVRHFAVRAYSEIFHVAATISAYYAFSHEKWWMNMGRLLFYPPPHTKYTFAMKLYYNFGVGTYLYKTAQLMYRTYRLGFDRDFLEVFIHHLITLGLMFFTYFTGYAHWGVLVLFAHNFSDSFTYIARMGNDVKHMAWMIISFPFMLIAWFSCRLFVFPYIIMAGIPWGRPYLDDHNPPLVLLICILLFALYTMHVYWSYGILCVFYGIVNRGWQDTKLIDEYNKEDHDGDISPIGDPTGRGQRRRDNIKERIEI